jgi:hypothetical protein
MKGCPRKSWRAGILLVSLGLVNAASPGQYYGERVLQKGFEQCDFFFTPSNVIPYGLGQFAGTTPGVLRDPLLDLVLNPAHLRLDSTHSDMMIYTDFRAARAVKDQVDFVYPWYGVADVRSSLYMPYPAVYLQNRRELEPVFSGALIGRPLGEAAPGLILGMTYQLVMQDQKYYSVPQDIYRTVVGADYAGRSSALSESNMPIVDKYSGQDNMHQTGHFVSVFARQTFWERLDVGAKLSRVTFERNGAFGSSNFWDSYYSASSSTSLWASMETRDQGYAHWELSGGALLHVNEKTTLGLSAGHVWGTATQSLSNLDTSYYGYTYDQSKGIYDRSMNKLQLWRNEGRTTQFGIELRSRVAAGTTLTLFFRPRWSSIQLHTAGSVLDTNYSYYTYQNNNELYTSSSRYRFSDVRIGGGEEQGNAHLMLGTLTWDLDSKVTLSLGAQLEFMSRETKTVDNVQVHGLSTYWHDYNSTPHSAVYQDDEIKDLIWTFTAKRRSFRIPVFITFRPSQATGILLGLSRDMTTWEIDDVTLAAIHYRYMNRDGAVTERQNFGERYTQPREEVSDITTTFMAGFTLSPSSMFQARLLVVPVFSEGIDGQELEQFQWWLGLTVTP